MGRAIIFLPWTLSNNVYSFSIFPHFFFVRSLYLFMLRSSAFILHRPLFIRFHIFFCAISVPQYPSEFHSQSFFVCHQSFSIIPICIHASLFRMQNTWGWLVAPCAMKGCCELRHRCNFAYIRGIRRNVTKFREARFYAQAMLLML
jgi:hypothetical protein